MTESEARTRPKVSVVVAGWRWPRVERLVDVEWAKSRQLPMPDRLLGVNTAFAVAAG